MAPAVLEEAYQFGLSRNSHMSFAFDDAKVREKYVLSLNTLLHCVVQRSAHWDWDGGNILMLSHIFSRFNVGLNT